MQTEIKHEAERLADAAKTNLMIEGTIWKQLLLFSIPLILGNLLQQMYNTADSIIVGQSVGSNALAAVSASTSLINLLINLFMGLSVGTNVVVARDLGAGPSSPSILERGTGRAFTAPSIPRWPSPPFWAWHSLGRVSRLAASC